VSSALALLSNAVMSSNTIHMQRAIDQLEVMSGEAAQTADLRRIAPTQLEGNNLRGTFDFPIARHAHHLLPSIADLNAKQRRLA
jgi:predicted component of viral defense system (DUF524 family)